jgi:hypothetical protein
MSTMAMADGRSAHAARGSLGALALGALGVVYGDIGTSPLYTMKTALDWGGGATPEVAIGMLSLIVWTLLITTSIKYVAVVMRADNDGEGGILALMSLLGIKHGDRAGVIAIGVLGAALSFSVRRICAGSCDPMLITTTTSEHIGHWIKMRRSLARFSALESSVRTRYLADFIITMPGVRFSLHTGFVVNPRWPA